MSSRRAMRPPPLLDLASELLRAVLRFDSPADGLLSEFFRGHRQLGPRERQTLAETAYAVIRQRLVLRHLAQGGGGTLERRLAILAWAGDERTLTAWLSAAEIDWLAQARAVDRDLLPEAMRLNLPDWLAQALRAELSGPGDGAEFLALLHAIDEPAPLDLRVNALKIKRDAAQRSLAESGIATEPTAWSPWGLRVIGKPSLLKTPAYRDGEVEIQDEGSQLIAALLDAHRGEMVVDFCAGAGGKTLAIGAAMRNTGRLYAFDTSGHRLAALKPRLERSGLSNVYPVQISHERDERIARLAGKVDRVLVDAPCSGLGTLRRNPDLKWRQTPEAVAALCEQQAAILAAAAQMLKPGGRLVYATCSLLSAENEAIADDFGAHHRDFTALPADELLASARVPQPAIPALVRAGHLRLWPHRHGSDGFFAATWQRAR